MKKLLALILCGLMVLSFSGYAEEGVQDGAYNVVGPGFYGDLDVTVTIADGRIDDITVANCPETPELGGKAIEIMTAAMVENNTSGVDSVTGATVTSAFFRRAVNEALKQANAPEAMKAHVEAPEKTAETLDCDVLVMGSGTAGLSAAIAAAVWMTVRRVRKGSACCVRNFAVSSAPSPTRNTGSCIARSSSASSSREMGRSGVSRWGRPSSMRNRAL